MFVFVAFEFLEVMFLCSFLDTIIMVLYVCYLWSMISFCGNVHFVLRHAKIVIVQSSVSSVANITSDDSA